MQNLFKFFSIITFCFFSILPIQILAEENLKIGLLIPMTGENEKLALKTENESLKSWCKYLKKSEIEKEKHNKSKQSY